MPSDFNLSVLERNAWSEEGKECREDLPPKDGKNKLSRTAAAVFIFGEMAGSGILALPYAVKGTGWSGLFVIMFCCILSGISAVYLGKSWNIIEERWPEYRITQADPYAIIGLKAFGKKVQVVVSLLVSVQLYGVAIVFLSICTELFVGVLKSLELSFTFSTCEWVIIIGLLIIPLTWLSSPAEISWIAYGAMCCTAISFVLLIALYCKALVDEEHKSEAPSTVNFKSYFLSLGTIAFVYGGAATFPTFQNHMKDKKQFSHSVFSAFSAMLILYVLIAVGGYYLFGNAVERNVLDNLQPSILKTIISVLMAIHVSAAILIVINPVNIAFEETVGVTGVIGKSLIRTLVCLSMICVALTIPKFDKIMNLVGATTVSTTSFMFPPIFYLRLILQNHPNSPQRKISIFTIISCAFIIVVGFVGGIVSTYSSIEDIISPGSFTKPCFLV